MGVEKCGATVIDERRQKLTLLKIIYCSVANTWCTKRKFRFRREGRDSAEVVTIECLSGADLFFCVRTFYKNNLAIVARRKFSNRLDLRNLDQAPRVRRHRFHYE